MPVSLRDQLSREARRVYGPGAMTRVETDGAEVRDASNHVVLSVRRMPSGRVAVNELVGLLESKADYVLPKKGGR